MNVEDFNVEIPEGDMLEIIFNHQRDLMDRYHLIEEKNVGHWIPAQCYPFDPPNEPGWLYAGALEINDRTSQLRFKDFAWRITEELTEATLALGEENENHYLEELIDALHFSVELMCLCGLCAQSLVNPKTPDDCFIALFHRSTSPPLLLKDLAFETIEKLGEAMNRLKMKPWKTTAMLTDEKAFKKSLTEFFLCLIHLLKASGFTAKTATQMYLNKNAVNQFRQRTNY